MRSIALLIPLCLLLSLSALAQRSDFSGLKFCIDPGHGGANAANDRRVEPDPGNVFWESESNFQKALLLKSMLEARGATVILTRSTNSYPDDALEPSLAARVRVANDNNVDWFHSIHSNATGGTNTGTNLTLVLVREDRNTRQPVWPQAVTMANKIYDHIRAQIRTNTYAGYPSGTAPPGVAYDYSFYGGTNGGFNLGVLSGLGMPGELSEGSFHDYFPETRRLMNNSYRKMEAYGLLKALMEYYGVPADTLGTVAGILTAGLNGPPVNKAAVRLLPNNVVYTGDAFNNGWIMFDGLATGSYKLRVETSGYLRDSVSFTLSPGQILFADRSLAAGNSDDSIAPYVTSHAPEPFDSVVSPSILINLTFNERLDPASALRSTGNFTLKDVTTASPPVLPLVRHDVRWNRSAIFCWLSAGLVPGHVYQFRASQLKDVSGNMLAGELILNFQVDQAPLSSLVMESFETGPLTQWNAPAQSPFTTGVVADSTSFRWSNAIPGMPLLYPNLGSGQLRYGWNQSIPDGLLHVSTAEGSSVAATCSPAGKKLQLYVNGDGSGTLFRFVVDDSILAASPHSPSAREVSSWIAVDWIGWRLVEWVFDAEAPGSWIGDGRLDGMIRFNGFQLERSAGGSSQFGEIYVDQLQLVTMTATGVAQENASSLPNAIVLYPNYPNPFNPGTAIRYQLSAVSMVTLKVYDVLGREVAVLANGVQQAGLHEVMFHAGAHPSGSYFYTLNADGATITRPMLLLR